MRSIREMRENGWKYQTRGKYQAGWIPAYFILLRSTS
jgi:hypothetical protein